PCETSGRQDRPHHEPPAGSENRMNSRSLRGTRLGSLSMETDEGVLAAPRQEAVYDCPNGHTIVLPFSVEADVPAIWSAAAARPQCCAITRSPRGSRASPCAPTGTCCSSAAARRNSRFSSTSVWSCCAPASSTSAPTSDPQGPH